LERFGPSMINHGLHPNLARIAAAHNDLVERYRNHQITTIQAQTEASELIARDDMGIRWRINPTSGQWEHETQTGQWKQGAPPQQGVASLTPQHFGSINHQVFDPDNFIVFLEHDPPADGIYQTVPQTGQGPVSKPKPFLRVGLMLLVMICIIAATLVFYF